MKCLLLVRRKCRITNELCSNPVELGDEKTCEVYKTEFTKWFKPKVLKKAKDAAVWFRKNLDSSLDNWIVECDIIEDVIQRLYDDGLGADVDVIERKLVERTVEENWGAIVKYAEDHYTSE